MTDLRGKTICGTFFHAPGPEAIQVLADALIAVDGEGRIEAVLAPTDTGHASAREAAEAAGRLVVLPEGRYVLPGFVDLHVHAPQYPQLGQALDVPLEVWLTRYTFPLEARYADPDFAAEAYSALVADLLAGGTTAALYFATLHQEATRRLVDICLDKGQRALVGKVVMDDPTACPEYYRDTSAEAAVAGTRALINYIRAHPGNGDGRVLPVITPRFIPSCTDEALSALGALAAETRCHVQTHCSESDWAHAHVLARHGRTDAESLDGFGLLTRRTVLAHCNFLTAADLDLLAARGSAVAHCALSNAYFANAVFPLRRALEKGVRVGLGTDISGGPSASLFDAARAALMAARMLESGVDPDLPAETRGRPGARIGMATAFHLATAGGGAALDLPIGSFREGFRFDAMVIDSNADQGTIRLFGETAPEEILHKIIYTASRPNIAAVWVGGRRVAGERSRVAEA